MPIDFYYCIASSPSAAALLTAKALGLNLNMKFTNLGKREQRSAEFTKMSPQHTVPAINDNGFVLSESRAIMQYLVNKYGKDDSLYPKDPKKRAAVDHMMFFDIGTLYARCSLYYLPVFFGKDKDVTQLDRLKEAFEIFNTYLAKSEFAAGNTLTIADLTLVTTISTCEIANVDFSSYKNISRWYAKVKAAAPGYKEVYDEILVHIKAFMERFTKT